MDTNELESIRKEVRALRLRVRSLEAFLFLASLALAGWFLIRPH